MEWSSEDVMGGVEVNATEWTEVGRGRTDLLLEDFERSTVVRVELCFSTRMVST